MTASGRFISVGSCWDGSTNGTASFVDSRNAHGLWKLPEPWTPRTRPPLLAKRADAFRTATTGPLPGDLQSTSVTHVPGLLCYRCSRLHHFARPGCLVSVKQCLDFFRSHLLLIALLGASGCCGLTSALTRGHSAIQTAIVGCSPALRAHRAGTAQR